MKLVSRSSKDLMLEDEEEKGASVPVIGNIQLHQNVDDMGGVWGGGQMNIKGKDMNMMMGGKGMGMGGMDMMMGGKGMDMMMGGKGMG